MHANTALYLIHLLRKPASQSLTMTLPCALQEAEGSDEDIDRAIQRAMHRAIAAEAALAAAVVAGEVDLTLADPNQEEAQPEPMAGIETAGQAAAEAAAELDDGRALNRASSERANTDDAEEVSFLLFAAPLKAC